MKTFNEVLEDVRRKKSCSRAMLYNYLKRFEIKPIGLRQRPQLWPKETAEIIINNLIGRVISMPQLRRARKRAQKARAK